MEVTSVAISDTVPIIGIADLPIIFDDDFKALYFDRDAGDGTHNA